MKIHMLNILVTFTTDISLVRHNQQGVLFKISTMFDKDGTPSRHACAPCNSGRRPSHKQGDNSPCQNVYSDSLTGTHLESNGNQCRLFMGTHS